MFPPAMHKGSSLFTWTTPVIFVLFCFVLITAILICVKQYPIKVFVCISLIIVMFSIFIGLLTICIFLGDLFMFFIQFFIGSFVVVVELWKFFIYSGYKPFIRSMILKYYILFYELLFFFFFFLAALEAYGNSRDRMESSLQLQLQQCQILDTMCQARDQIGNAIETRRTVNHGTTVGTLHFYILDIASFDAQKF